MLSKLVFQSSKHLISRYCYWSECLVLCLFVVCMFRFTPKRLKVLGKSTSLLLLYRLLLLLSLRIIEVIMLFYIRNLNTQRFGVYNGSWNSPPIWNMSNLYCICMYSINLFFSSYCIWSLGELSLLGGKGKRKGAIPYTMWESVLIVKFRKSRATWEMGPRHVCRGLYWLQ